MARDKSEIKFLWSKVEELEHQIRLWWYWWQEERWQCGGFQKDTAQSPPRSRLEEIVPRLPMQEGPLPIDDDHIETSSDGSEDEDDADDDETCIQENGEEAYGKERNYDQEHGYQEWIGENQESEGIEDDPDDVGRLDGETGKVRRKKRK